VQQPVVSLNNPDFVSAPSGSVSGEPLEHSSSQQILRWAVETYGQDLLMTSSFGMNGVALIHMLQEITRIITILFIDTGYHFPETLKTKQRIEAKYGLKIQVLSPQLSIKDQAQMYGLDLFEHSPDLCCTLRKDEPMQRALERLQPKAILNARSRSQIKTGQDLPVIERMMSPVWVHPLARWPHQQIEDYVRSNGVPYNPLHDRDYPSVGCWPCTRPLRPGEHIRAGRWTGRQKEECGLWATHYL
jgi:phosphoadenosine phosphosulfate reductase